MKQQIRLATLKKIFLYSLVLNFVAANQMTAFGITLEGPACNGLGGDFERNESALGVASSIQKSLEKITRGIPQKGIEHTAGERRVKLRVEGERIRISQSVNDAPAFVFSANLNRVEMSSTSESGIVGEKKIEDSYFRRGTHYLRFLDVDSGVRVMLTRVSSPTGWKRITVKVTKDGDVVIPETHFRKDDAKSTYR